MLLPKHLAPRHYRSCFSVKDEIGTPAICCCQTCHSDAHADYPDGMIWLDPLTEVCCTVAKAYEAWLADQAA